MIERYVVLDIILFTILPVQIKFINTFFGFTIKVDLILK